MLIVAAALAASIVVVLQPAEPATAHGTAIGTFDIISHEEMENSRIRVAGWALSTSHPTSQLTVRILVNGTPTGSTFAANLSRPDVGAAYPCCGNYHGFAAWVTVPFPATYATNTVCAQALLHSTWYNLNQCHTYDWVLDPIYPSTDIPAQCYDSGMWSGGWLACLTDGYYTSRCYDTSYHPFTSKALNGVNATMVYTYNTTDLNTTRVDSPCVLTGSGETDIVYRELSNLPGSAWGFVYCDDATSSTRCDQHYVSFDKEVIASGSFVAEEMWKLACHETGHAVGLLHGASMDPNVSNTAPVIGCMRNGGYNNASTNPWLGANNANWINLTY